MTGTRGATAAMTACPHAVSAQTARMEVRTLGVPGTNISGTIAAEPRSSSPTLVSSKPRSDRMCVLGRTSLSLLTEATLLVRGRDETGRDGEGRGHVTSMSRPTAGARRRWPRPPRRPPEQVLRAPH
ncbi:hypothetical protein FMEAI12_4660014 [Parafrankia sp. Ea1.12]|nr:hypothetical protein FMEAI12_4660014 [Parafrankia sp. Ea1.12]